MEALHTLTLLILFRITASASSLTGFMSNITKSPEKSNTVLIGNEIKLEWKFKFQPANELDKISLFRYSFALNAKNTIAYNNASSNHIVTRFRERGYSCQIWTDTSGVGSALILIKNIQFNHTGDYGIRLHPRQQHLPVTENSVSIKVVDMVADQPNHEKTVTSWIGKRTLLHCGVIVRAKARPTFRWIRSPDKELITHGVTTFSNGSILTIASANTTDFGEYICETTTTLATVRQRILVTKLGYSAPPAGLKYNYNKETGIHAFFWKQTTAEGHHWANEYVVEIMEPQEKTWKIFFRTEKLFAAIKNLQSKTKVRVCSSNEIGYIGSSCSKPIDVVFSEGAKRTPGTRGICSHIQSRYLLVLAMVFLSAFMVPE